MTKCSEQSNVGLWYCNTWDSFSKNLKLQSWYVESSGLFEIDIYSSWPVVNENRPKCRGRSTVGLWFSRKFTPGSSIFHVGKSWVNPIYWSKYWPDPTPNLVAELDLTRCNYSRIPNTLVRFSANWTFRFFFFDYVANHPYCIFQLRVCVVGTCVCLSIWVDSSDMKFES